VLATTLGPGTPRSLDLLCQSASDGNGFAQTRLGFLCCGDVSLSPGDLIRLIGLLEGLGHDVSNAVDAIAAGALRPVRDALAAALWEESATKGDATAQAAFADVRMAEYARTREAATALDAATLFALSGMQGYAPAGEALLRAVEFVMERGDCGVAESMGDIAKAADM